MGKILTKKRKLARKEPMQLPVQDNEGGYGFGSLSPPASDHETDPFGGTNSGRFDSPTPGTPMKSEHYLTPLNTPPSTPSVYSLAKGLFQRGSKCTEVFGREKEKKVIYDFLNPLIKKSGAHGALYLSGVPGTGKSAILSETLAKITEIRPKVKQANINCMVVDKPAFIFHIIYEALKEPSAGDKRKRGTAKQPQNQPEEQSHSVNGYLELSETEKIVQKLDDLFLNHPRTSHIVVLDELDHVMTKDQEVLFKIFQWAFMEKSNLILIGIANALNLTDRFLPRLRANSLSPQVLPFTPYTASEIAYIIEQRLRTLTGTEDSNGPIPLLDVAAIQFCARKTAANTGDLRKAMDICRRAIEMVEEEVRRQIAMEAYGDEIAADSADSSAEDKDSLWKKSLITGGSVAAASLASISELTLENAPKATVMHVAKICTVAFGGSTVSRIKDLNLHQKAVLCVLVHCERTVVRHVDHQGSAVTMTVSKLYDHYTKISEREMVLGKLNLNEFFDVVSALEAAGLLSISGVCGRKGLGSGGRSRSSQGGGGAAVAKSSMGYRDEYGLRKVVSTVHIMDLTTALSDIPLLRQFII